MPASVVPVPVVWSNLTIRLLALSATKKLFVASTTTPQGSLSPLLINVLTVTCALTVAARTLRVPAKAADTIRVFICGILELCLTLGDVRCCGTFPIALRQHE